MAAFAPGYAQALKDARMMRIDIESFFPEFDALLTPGAPGEAPLGLSSTGNSVMQRPWSTTGLPSIGLPVGLSRNGLPLAIQLGSRGESEAHLLAVAKWCEDALQVKLRPPVE